MNLSGNTVLITGGSSGIGFEMARQFLKRDNKVIITRRNEKGHILNIKYSKSTFNF
jgi:uncharacterized oxidoreductase